MKLLCTFAVGPLIPRHVEVFRANSFFKGISLPTPDKMVHTVHTIMTTLHEILLLFIPIGTIGTKVFSLSTESN